MYPNGDTSWQAVRLCRPNRDRGGAALEVAFAQSATGSTGLDLLLAQAMIHDQHHDIAAFLPELKHGGRLLGCAPPEWCDCPSGSSREIISSVWATECKMLARRS
jgi:hypothetical protein